MFSTKDATTVRPASNALLAIDSEDRFKDYVEARNSSPGGYNSSPYDFQITKSESMMNGFFTRIGISEIIFNWSIPNINPKTNSVIFYWQDRTGEHSAVITLLPGFYTPAQLAQSLTELLDNVLPGTVAAYGNLNLPNFTFVPPADTVIRFAPLDYNSAEYPFPPSTKQLFDLLGLTYGEGGTYSGTITGAYTLCQACRYVDIVCPQLSYNMTLRDSTSQPASRNVLCRLYLDAPAPNIYPSSPLFAPPGAGPFTLYRQFPVPKYIPWSADQPVSGTLRFQVYDDQGAILGDFGTLSEPLYLSDWSMSLLVSEN